MFISNGSDYHIEVKNFRNYSAIVILDIFAFTFLSFRTTVRNLSFCCLNHHHYRNHCIRQCPSVEYSFGMTFLQES